MKYVIVILSMFLLAGCSLIRKDIVKLAQEDAKNAEVSRIAARQIGATWPLNSGLLTPALKTLKGIIPCDCEEDIKSLDKIAAKCIAKDTKGIVTCEELDDTEMGNAEWYWGKIWGSLSVSGVKEALKKIAPTIVTRLVGMGLW